jgi:replication factor C subunit 3/5
MNDLPWVEKYRPAVFNDLVSHNVIINCLKKLVKNNALPHLLFHGTPGTGKTSTILSLTKKLYGSNKEFMVLELNASDDRGINSVREEIKQFAETKNIFNTGIKLIILDEADSMTYDAQFALRRIIEEYSLTTRFCIICNYLNKIIPAIISRCLMLRFSPIDKDNINLYLNRIIKNENLVLNKTTLDTISYISEGDMRKAVNLLQSVSLTNSEISSDLCYEISGYPIKEDITKLFISLMNPNNFNESLNILDHYINYKKYSLCEVVDKLANELFMSYGNYNMDDKRFIYLVDKLSDIHNQINSTFNYDIYVQSVVGIFYLALKTE